MSESSKNPKDEIAEKRKLQGKIEDKSIIMVCTGEGKGKTTAAFGTLMRTIAHGWRGAMVQFMKSSKDFHYGEVKLAEKFDTLDIFTMGAGFTWNTQDFEKDKKLAHEAWERAVDVMESGKYHTVMLDEILYAIHYKFLEEQTVIGWLKKKPKGLNIILTGRYASDLMIETADLVTEMKNIKHPYKEKNLLAQKGIDW